MHTSIRLFRKKVIASILYYIFYFVLLLIRMYKGSSKTARNTVLVIDLELIGDAVMVTPMIRNLLLNRDKVSSLDMLCLTNQREIYETCTGIRNIFCLSGKAKVLKGSKIMRPLRKMMYCFYIIQYVFRNLYSNYSTVIVPRWDTDEECSAIVALLTDADERIAYSEKVSEFKALHNTGRDMYFTKTFLCNAACHESEKFLKLIEQAGYCVYDRAISLPYKSIYSFQGVSLLRPYAVLALDTSKEDREWKIENFVEVGRWLLERKMHIVLLGTKKIYADKFINMLGREFCTSLVGRTTLTDATNIIGDSSIYLGGNTGLSHIAGAVAIKGVVLFSIYDDEPDSDPAAPLRMRPKSDSIIVLQPKRSETTKWTKPINLIEPISVIRQLEKIL